MLTETIATSQTIEMVLIELQRCSQRIDNSQLEAAAQELLAARRIFFVGAGRSGLALKMGAMRMMHLGLQVYVAGDIATPAIEQGDLLVIASGSGTTASALQAARTATTANARVLVFTTAPSSPLASFASTLVEVPAAAKQQFEERPSQQYAGSLFEQTILLLLDALFHQRWQQRGESQEQLWKRHANLE